MNKPLPHRILPLLLSFLLTSTHLVFGFSPNPYRVYEIVCIGTNTALEIGGGGDLGQNAHRVNAWPYFGGANQQWVIQSADNGSFAITNRNSNQCLSEYTNTAYKNGDYIVQSYAFGVGSPSNTNIAAYPAVALWNFDLVPGTTDVYTISNRDSGLLLETLNAKQKAQRYSRSGSTNTQLYDNDYSWVWDNATGFTPAQQYQIIDRSANPNFVYEQSAFRLINRNSAKYLTVSQDNNGVSQVGPNTTPTGTQEWTFSAYNSDGYFYIYNRRSPTTVLEIGNDTDYQRAGHTANTGTYTGGANQQWAAKDLYDSHLLSISDITNGGYIFKLVNRASGLILEIGGNASDLMRDSQPADQWYDYSNDGYHNNQQWRAQQSAFNRLANPLATTQASSSLLEVYPNPATSELIISLPGAKVPTSVQVFDAQGRLITTPLRKGKLDVMALAPGIYLLTATDGQTQYKQKFIKQ
jgi:hypothetical protein